MLKHPSSDQLTIYYTIQNTAKAHVLYGNLALTIHSTDYLLHLLLAAALQVSQGLTRLEH